MVGGRLKEGGVGDLSVFLEIMNDGDDPPNGFHELRRWSLVRGSGLIAKAGDCTQFWEQHTLKQELNEGDEE